MDLSFTFYRTPRIIYGPGKRKLLPDLLKAYGSPVLLVRSAHALNENDRSELIHQLCNSGIHLIECISSGEPSPEFVDHIVNSNRQEIIKAVVAIGGGSVIDAGKAISAMIPLKESVYQYMEVIGSKKHPGVKVPFFALPTTAGTGSESSANAVLSKVGPDGFKRSIRHDNLVPDCALVDPELTLSCPASVTASCGMDALTQLLESYVSPKASLFTDSLIEKALPLIGNNLLKATGSYGNDIQVRTSVAYASMISGITLANAGLGVVHGLASAIGGLFPIPHGVVCGTLVATATQKNIRKLQIDAPESEALMKYNRAGFLLSNQQGCNGNGCAILLEQLDKYTTELNLPRLSTYGVTQNDIATIVKESGNKNNPVQLSDEEIGEIVMERI